MKRIFYPLLLLALAIPLPATAQGVAEAEQRAAFIQILKNRSEVQPLKRLPALTSEQEISIGEYAAHYAVMDELNAALMDSMDRGRRAVNSISFNSNDAKIFNVEVDEARKTLSNIAEALAKEQVKATTARAGFSQPSDVKVAYDMVFERSMDVPIHVVLDQFIPTSILALDRMMASSSFAIAHMSELDPSSPAMDPAIRAEFQRQLHEAESIARKIAEIAERLLDMGYDGEGA